MTRRDHPESASYPIAHDRPADVARYRIGHTDRCRLQVGMHGGTAAHRRRQVDERKASGPDHPTMLAKCREGVPIADALYRHRRGRQRRQAESRARPRSRRALSTARPPLVDMRWRNPCFLARFRLFG